MKSVAISALSSGQGKTLFTISLLQWLKNSFGKVRPFKVGPDYIDPRFHEKITGVSSINLDLYMMSEEEVKKAYSHYTTDIDACVVEGVMGFYDGIDYGTSTYEVTKTINVPTVLVISAEGSYATLVPTLKGILDYKADNTVKGIVFNKVSSEKHYETIVKQFKKELPELKILGWIKKGLNVLSSRHLGLDLNELDNKELNEVSNVVLENIDKEEFLKFMECTRETDSYEDSFVQNEEKLYNACKDLTVTIVKDKAFSFIYTQNIDFFNKFYKKVYTISAYQNETIPKDTDIVYIPGGYVETPEVAKVLDQAHDFKRSLLEFSQNKNKKIFAECAGLMFLGQKIQTTEGDWINGTGILPLNFEMQKRRNRLGYYKAIDKDDLIIYKGHAFHYSCPVLTDEAANIKLALFKDRDNKASIGGWTNNNRNVVGTYLHSLFYNQPELVLDYLTLDEKNSKNLCP